MTATLNNPAGQQFSEAHKESAGWANLPDGQSAHDAQMALAVGNSNRPPAATFLPPPMAAALQEVTSSPEGQVTSDAQRLGALGGPDFPADQEENDTHHRSVGGDLSPSSSQHSHDTHMIVAVAGPIPPDSQLVRDAQTPSAVRGPILRDGLLSLLAEAVDDLERVRIASENRYRQLTRSTEDSDGKTRGLGLDDAVPEILRVHQVVDGLIALEHQAVLNLQRQMRKHPLWINWGAEAKGVGQKQLARLLASIGDPYWNDLHDRPRTVSELWAYSGFHVVHPADQDESDSHILGVGGVAARRQKGSRVNWSTDARMRAWLITGACLKAQGHYAAVYYAAKEKYAEATHSTECVRCGPKGKPALPGSPLSKAHIHARGLRAMAKEILKDLWLTARDIHQSESLS